MSLLQNVFHAVASSAFVLNVGWLLVHSLWQCMLVAFLAMCLAKMMRRQSSSARYGMLTIAMSLMVISPVATILAFPQTEVPIPASGEGIKSVSVESVGDLQQQIEGDNGDAIPIVPPPTDARRAVSEIQNEKQVHQPGPVSIAASYSSWMKVTLGPWLSTIVAWWCCGVLLFSIRPIWGWMMVRRLLRTGTSPVAAPVQQALQRMCEKMQVQRRIEVLASSLVGSPIVVGCFRSVILVPASFVSSLPVSQLEAILAHELAHVRRYDYLVNLLQTLVETLFFYHPAVWWLSHRIRVERENCCDDWVVSVLEDKVEYGRALLAVEEFRGSAASSSLALSAKDGSLLARVMRLFADASHDTPRMATGAWLVGLLLVIAAAATMWTYAAAQGNSDKANSSEAVAKLPGGLTARLLGVGYHPSADKPWWNASGELLKEPLKPEGGARMFEGTPQQAKCREFVFQIDGLGKDCAVRPDFGGRGSGVTSSLSAGIWRGYCATGPFDDPATTVRLGIIDEPFGPTLVINADGRTATRDGIPPSLRLLYDQFQSRGIVQEDGWRLAADSLDKLSEKADWKLVAVDTQGKSQRYTSMSGGEGKVSFGFGIPQQNIDHFEFQLRPYRHWVTFENVSLEPGKMTEVKAIVEAVSNVTSATKAGRWQVTQEAELEITQKLVHAADVMTSGVIRIKDANGNSRHVPLSIAVDVFGNRERWKAVWEEGKPVLWYAKGLGDGPGRKLPPGAKVKVEELQRIDFSNPDCIEHRGYTGWAADQLPSAELRTALEEMFEIKANEQEHARYYESAVLGMPATPVEHLHIWIGEHGTIEVENIVWVPNETSRELKCTYATLSETLALVMKKYRDKKVVSAPVYAFISSRPQLASADLNSVLDACRRNRLITPVLPQTAEVSSIGGSVDQNQPKPALATNAPFRLPDHGIVEDLQWLDGDKELITVSLQGGVNVRRWNVQAKSLLSEIKLQSDVHGRPIQQGTLKLSADGRRVIGVTDAYVGVWDTTTGQLMRQLPIPQQKWSHDTVRCLNCSPDGSIIVAGLETSFSKTTLVYPTFGIAWNADSGEVLCRFEQDAGFELREIIVTKNGLQFFTLSRGHKISLWETRTGKLLKEFSNLTNDWPSPNVEVIKNLVITGIALSPDERQLAIASTFGIRLVEWVSGKLQRTIDAPYHIGSAGVVYSADCNLLARFGARPQKESEDSVLIWSVADGRQQTEIECDSSQCRFSLDGHWLASAESDFYEALSVWPLIDEDKLGPLPAKSYSRTNRVEENTHYRGAKAKEFVDQWKPAWGAPQDGIQYGVALTSPTNQFHIGQRVLMAAFLRNEGTAPKHIALRPDMFGNVPHITDADGELIRLETRPLLGRPAHYRETLQPGECFGPLYLNFGVGQNPQPGRQHWEPFWNSPQTGALNLVHKTQFHVADLSVDRNSGLDGNGWRAGELVSGVVAFNVLPPRHEPSGDDSNREGNQIVPQALPKDSKINWSQWRKAWREFYAAQLASDLTLIRNATIDLTGIEVTDDAAKQFVNDAAPDKRLRLIEEILAGDAFAKFHSQQRDENDAFQTRQQTLPPRILRGPAAQLRADVYQPRAGKPVDGLTLSIALRTASNRFKAGERIPLDVLLFNATSETMTLDFSFDFIANPPRVVDETGNEVPIEELFLSGSIPLYRETLRPGGFFLYPHIGLGLGENSKPGENWHPHTPPLKPGKYRLTQRWKDLTSGDIEFEIIATLPPVKADEAKADETDSAVWLRFCPGTQIVGHTDDKFVSGVVVDEGGQPISGCRVEHPGLVGPTTDEQGKFQYRQSKPHPTVLRVYHPDYRLWHGAPQLGDVLRIVLQKKPRVEAVDGTRQMTVRVIDSRTAEPVPGVQVTAVRWEGPRNNTSAGTETTNDDGVAVFRGLDFIRHELRLSADRPIPYIGSRSNPSGGEHEVAMLVDRACELVLRAVDSETGKGIAGVTFERENVAGERWQQSIGPDILGGRHEQQAGATDVDGYCRCLVSSYPWSYMVGQYPKGYDAIVPIDGRQEVEIETPVGSKVEYTFRLVKTKAAGATEAPGHDAEAARELDKLRRMGWQIDVPVTAVVRSDDVHTTIEAIEWEVTIPGDGVPELRKVKAKSVRLTVPRDDATASRLELQGDVMIFTSSNSILAAAMNWTPSPGFACRSRRKADDKK